MQAINWVPPRRRRQAAQPDPHVGAYRDRSWLQPFRFTSKPSLHDEDFTEYDIFANLLSDRVIDIMLKETNRYAEQYLERKGGINNLPPKARARKWTPVTLVEMRAFIGLILYMGLVRLPTYEMYWSNEELFQLGIKKVMSRDRFQLILSFFHCADNTQQPPRGDPNYDRLHKVREVCDVCIDNWQGAWQLGREVSVDETVIGFSGTSSLVNYNPSKPHKWGITVWSLADPRSGYVYNWDIFAGKKSVPDPRIDPSTGRGTVHWVVWDLLEGADVLGKSHHVYMDNYFSSATLFNDLAEVNTGACGTLRTNRRGTPEVIKRAKPSNKDPAVTVESGHLTFFRWMDRNMVTLVSSVHNTASFVKRTRTRNDPSGWQERVKPNAIELYTAYMRGVDLADQSLWYNLNLHKSLKWWKKVIFALIEVCFTNTLAIYKAANPEKKVYRNKVRMAIINALVADSRRQAVQQGPALPPAFNPEVTRLDTTLPHFPEVIKKEQQGDDATEAGAKVIYHDCIVCSDRSKKRHVTKYQCTECKKALCPAPCFERYHTLKDGWQKSCAVKEGDKWVFDKEFHN